MRMFLATAWWASSSSAAAFRYSSNDVVVEAQAGRYQMLADDLAHFDALIDDGDAWRDRREMNCGAGDIICRSRSVASVGRPVTAAQLPRCSQRFWGERAMTWHLQDCPRRTAASLKPMIDGQKTSPAMTHSTQLKRYVFIPGSAGKWGFMLLFLYMGMNTDGIAAPALHHHRLRLRGSSRSICASKGAPPPVLCIRGSISACEKPQIARIAVAAVQGYRC